MRKREVFIILSTFFTTIIIIQHVFALFSINAQSMPCASKSSGDANCRKDPPAPNKDTSLIDFEIWRKEMFGAGGCSSTATTGCGADEDGDGSAMDANFNYPGSGSSIEDSKVDNIDFEIWRKGYFATAISPTAVATISPSPSIGPTITSKPGSDPSFSCLDLPGPLQTITGFYGPGKFEPSVAPSKKFDARAASFEIPADISWGKVMLRGTANSTNMCWAGGYFTASLSWHNLNISWNQSKNGLDGTGTYRNTTSVDSFLSNTTWTGLHVFNVHDGIRTSDSDNNWTIQHSWLDYIRDDCVENDHIYSGTIYDSLFDGCYVGISTRPSSVFSAAGQTVKMDKVLLRMEPMPYPYKWDAKNDPYLTVAGYGTTPFGFGNVFKMELNNEPNFEITNTVFLLEYNAKKDIFPPKNKVTVCRNNILIWFGPVSEAPTYLLTDFPGCFTIMTDKTQGLTVWKNIVADWHTRHPEVGKNRKPAKPGEYKWPRY